MVGKTSKPKPIPLKKVADPKAAAQARRAWLHALAAVVFVGLCVAGVIGVRRYVERRVAHAKTPPAIVLRNRPPWMSDHLVRRIEAAVRPRVPRSALDHRMLVDVAAMLARDPWVKTVRQVRRVYGQGPGDTLEIDCDFHVPIALVKRGELYYLVDNNGILLPEHYTPAQVPLVVRGGPNRQVNVRVVTGVQCPKPPVAGQVWNGDDLIAGLELVKRLYGLPFAEEIEQVDVSNFQGRIDPREAQLVLVTRRGTQVRWGRPIHGKDYSFEALPEVKLRHMQQVFEQYGRIDAGYPWIDLRFDRVTHPRPEEPAQASGR